MITPTIWIGSRVTHRELPKKGVGTVIDVYFNTRGRVRLYYVRFPHCSSWFLRDELEEYSEPTPEGDPV